MIRPQVRVLEFTAIVVIIFAAVILGVLGLLGDQQIGRAVQRSIVSP